MGLSIVVATSNNGVIGVNNELPWHLPQDLQYFKKITNGKTVIMGRKTYESIGKPLSNRYNVILTKNKEYEADGCTVVHSLQEALEEKPAYLETMIIGGGQIYQEFLPLVDTIYLTLIDMEVVGDTNFQVPADFVMVNEEKHEDGILEDGTKISYAFQTYVKEDSMLAKEYGEAVRLAESGER